MSMEFEENEKALTYPMQASKVRVGSHVVINGHPCKVISTSTSKTGKHGHAKIHIEGSDIFTNNKYEMVLPTTHNVDVPIINRSEYTLMDISDDGFCSLLSENNTTKDDLKLPNNEMGKEIQNEFDNGNEVYVTVVGSMNIEMILGYKVKN